MKFSNKHINCLKSIDFDNAQFFIVCYNYILFNLNVFFWNKISTNLWNYLVPYEFYIYICRNDNFHALNKLTLKYQNAFDILNNFISEDKNNFLLLK